MAATNNIFPDSLLLVVGKGCFGCKKFRVRVTLLAAAVANLTAIYLVPYRFSIDSSVAEDKSRLSKCHNETVSLDVTVFVKQRILEDNFYTFHFCFYLTYCKSPV